MRIFCVRLVHRRLAFHMISVSEERHHHYWHGGRTVQTYLIIFFQTLPPCIDESTRNVKVNMHSLQKDTTGLYSEFNSY